MMSTSREKWDFDKIIDYFEGKLPVEEEQEILQQIEKDDEFAEWIDDAYTGWTEDPTNYRENIKSFQQRMYTHMEKASRKSGAVVILLKSKPFRLAVAAVVVLMICIPFFLRIPSCPLEDINCQLRQEGVYESKLNILGNSLDESIGDALQAYQNKQYALAIKGIEALPVQDIDNPYKKNELTLCLGVSLLIEGRTQDALLTFNQLLASAQDKTYVNEAQWYVALIQLNRSDYESARALLEKVIANKGSHYRQAEKLLKRIKD